MAATNLCSRCGYVLAALFTYNAQAMILPEDRSDVLYHSYEGGGVEVTGPAVLVRKGFAEKVSVAATYYVDNITSASIDVVTTASKYTDKREEKGLSVDYLYRDALLSLSYTNSNENDYTAASYDLNISQEMLGGMTTVSLGYNRGNDEVGRTDDPGFAEGIDRWQYRLGVSQVVTKSIIVSLDYDAISDEGFLNNPYRSARILGTTVPERYPQTRSSHATSFRAVKHFDYPATVSFSYRYFWDTWEINASNYELAYDQYLWSRKLLLNVYYRNYSQQGASFYSDEFSREQNYMARDKELSTFSSDALGAKISYVFLGEPWSILDKGTVNFSYEYISFDYDDYTDRRPDSSSFGEPYSFDANVYQLFVSLWY
ncbi:MAG: hypothetical protein BMS9Abin36_1426 [Gammaproteobacteria bacterium]|nr:MAG: hypothetical protein BMS9Abin36_1426 [Gammaproteobacteria bacterium]